MRNLVKMLCCPALQLNCLHWKPSQSRSDLLTLVASVVSPRYTVYTGEMAKKVLGNLVCGNQRHPSLVFPICIQRKRSDRHYSPCEFNNTDDSKHRRHRLAISCGANRLHLFLHRINPFLTIRTFCLANAHRDSGVTMGRKRRRGKN